MYPESESIFRNEMEEHHVTFSGSDECMDAHLLDDLGDENSSMATVGFVSSSAQEFPIARGATIEMQPVGEVKQFKTIDWARSADKDRNFLNEADHELSQAGSKEKVWKMKLYVSVQGWIAMIMVAAISGLIAQYVDTSTQLLSFMKLGVCKPWFWLPRGMCCLEYRGAESCPNWMEWNEAVGLTGYSATTTTAINFIAYLMFGALFCTFAAWLPTAYGKWAAGSGIAEVRTILGGSEMRRFLGGWTLIVKSMGLVFAVGSGMSVGKEGPFVHLAACVGHLVCRYFPKYKQSEGKRREVMAAACAAGVGVAFGSPIGGVLFSMEMVSTYFSHKTMWRAFFCACVSALVLQSTATGTAGQGKFIIFKVRYHHRWHWFELLPFILIGVIGGLVGQLFITVNMFMTKLKKKTKIGKGKWADHVIFDAFIWIMLTNCSQYFFEVLREPMLDMLRVLMGECHDFSIASSSVCQAERDGNAIPMLLFACGIKIVIFSLTFSAKIPGGNFVPAMFIGSLFGRSIGLGLRNIYLSDRSIPFFGECGNDEFCIIPGVYGMIGAACVLGGITRMTVSLVVIMIEVTSGLEYLVPLMISLLVSKLVGDAIDKRNLYDRYIELNHYPFLDIKRDYKYNGDVGGIVGSQETVSIPSQTLTVGELNDLLRSFQYRAFPVVVSMQNRVPIGLVDRAELYHTLHRLSLQIGIDLRSDMMCSFARAENLDQVYGSEPFLDLSSIVDPNPICVTDTSNIPRAIDLFKKLGIRTVLVVRNSELFGIITKNDIVEFIRSKSKDFKDMRLPRGRSFSVQIVRPDEMRRKLQ